MTGKFHRQLRVRKCHWKTCCLIAKFRILSLFGGFAMEDDYCIVCAEPLEWVAYAINCGHKDACSKCVARLRFVMKDTRCLLCQQLGSAVVVTRSLGAFTPTIPPQDSDKLKVIPLSIQPCTLSTCALYLCISILHSTSSYTRARTAVSWTNQWPAPCTGYASSE